MLLTRCHTRIGTYLRRVGLCPVRLCAERHAGVVQRSETFPWLGLRVFPLSLVRSTSQEGHPL